MVILAIPASKKIEFFIASILARVVFKDENLKVI